MYTKVNYFNINCDWCKAEFKPNRKDKKFCSKACYKKHGKKNKGHSDGNRAAKIDRVRPYLKYRELICAKCHRLKTATQLGWYK